MHPLSLTLEGFTCFKQRQTVSFDGLELFAIWGPTGAGKTSLLDAMVFALFGCIPRLGDNRNRDVISLTRDKAVVLFEFSVGTQKYRVVRTAKRRGAPEAKLEDGDGNLLAEGVRGVEAEILRRLGLSYDAFVQAVMLPQGDFARFLKSEPRERRVILRDLLRLEVYERMRGTAEQRRRDLEGRLSEIMRVLGEYASATPDRLEELHSKVGAAHKDRKTKQDDLTALSAHLQKLEAIRKKTEELEHLRQHFAEIKVHETEMQESRLQIDASERATALMPQILRAEDAQTTAGRYRDAARKAKEAVEKEREHYNRAYLAVKKAGEDAEQIGTLRDRIRALDGIRGTVEAKDSALGRLQSAKNAVVEADVRLRTVDTKLTGLRKDLNDLKRAVAKAEEGLRKVSYDKELDALAQRASRVATQLVEERKQAGAADEEAIQTEAAAAKARAEVEKKTLALEQARLKCDKTSASLDKAEKTYKDAHERHAAVVLRRALHPGELCPVCAQKILTVPKTIAAPDLDSITEKYNGAKRVEADARGVDKKLTAEHAALDAAAGQLMRVAARAKDASHKASRRVATLEGKLGEIVGKKFDKSGMTIEAQVLSGAERLADARAKHSQGSDYLAKMERDRDVAVEEIKGKETEIKGLQEVVDRAKHEVAKITTEFTELDAKIRAVTTYQDPLAESVELDKKVRELERRVDMAKAEFAEGQAKLATAQGIANDAWAKSDRAVEEAADLLRQAEVVVRKAAFDSFKMAKAAVIESAELAELRKTIEDYRVDYQSTDQRILALLKEIGGREVSGSELTEANQRFARARQEHEVAVGAVATIEEQIRQTQDRLEKRKQFGAEYDEIKIELGVYQKLAEELRTDRFQEFVLEEAFQDLARGASERLKELTGRYALKYQDGDILVEDHDNADEMRSADTLSGGETFLTSLSLALELSEQIQQAAGAVLLESLFVDEGFGTLDLEALDNVASAIESLRGGGRIVGIITHIRDLAERLPCRIEVVWRSEGSQVEVFHS